MQVSSSWLRICIGEEFDGSKAQSLKTPSSWLSSFFFSVDVDSIFLLIVNCTRPKRHNLHFSSTEHLSMRPELDLLTELFEYCEACDSEFADMLITDTVEQLRLAQVGSTT